MSPIEILYVGRLEWVRHLRDFTPREREKLADALSGYAADILKGAVMGDQVVDIYITREEKLLA